MKKHILSKFITQNDSPEIMLFNDKYGLTTYETRSIELTDADEFGFLESTNLTFTKEDSDADEFILNGPTLLTENVETTDPDEFCLVNIGQPFSQYETDLDEFL